MEDNNKNPIPSVGFETMERKTFIYALIDPRDNHIRYIGKADDPVYRTFFQKHHKGSHVNEAKYSKLNTHKLNWLRSLLKVDLLPILEILDEVPKNNWQHWEKWWIATEKEKINALNLPKLTNSTEGGDGFLGKHSQKSKNKIRESLKKSEKFIESRNKLKGKIWKMSEESKQKLKIASKLRNANPEYLENWRKATKGKKRTEEQKKRISEGTKKNFNWNNFRKGREKCVEINKLKKIEKIKIFEEKFGTLIENYYNQKTPIYQIYKLLKCNKNLTYDYIKKKLKKEENYEY